MTDSRATELLGRAQQGDMQAFAEVFEPLRPAVLAVAGRLVGADDAEDVVMETFLKAWQAIPEFGGRSSLKTWLFRIAHNQGVDWIRSRERRKEQQLVQSDTSTTDPWGRMADLRQKRPDEAAADAERQQEVTEALEKLPEEHRTALLLRYTDGMEYAEIAAAMGVSIGTVMSRLFYGKRKLRKIVEGVNPQ